MSKGKLAKFADMATYPNVFQQSPVFPIGDGNTPTSATRFFSMQGRWREDFFHNQNPIILELGCGRGEYTVELARRHPLCNYIGVDIKGARMWTGATQALSQRLANVAFLRTNIEFIQNCFAHGEVQEIWLTFPDPQMKKATKRLTSTFFLQRYRHLLADQGIIHLKTDSNFLYTYTRQLIETNKLPLKADIRDLYAETAPPDLTIRTYYEQQWLDRGLTIKYLSFCLPTATPLCEPDVEIPTDDYRSYNRQRRSTRTLGR